VNILSGGPAMPRAGNAGGRPARGDGVITAGAYVTLFLLGVSEGLIGSFFYSVGPAPLAALAFAVAIFVTCMFGAWGMLRAAGAVTVAVGWFAAAFLLGTVTGSGSVIITNTAAGQWFLFGGSAAVIAATIATFVGFSRASARGK